MSDWFAAEKSTKDRIREPGRTLTEEEITIDVDHPPVEALGTDFSSNIYSLAKRTSANLVSKTNNSEITPEKLCTKQVHGVTLEKRPGNYFFWRAEDVRKTCNDGLFHSQIS